MYLGSRCAYQVLFDLPYLFFLLLRSSKSISLTLGAFIMGKFLKKNQTVARKDIVSSVVVTVGLLVFNLSVSSLDPGVDPRRRQSAEAHAALRHGHWAGPRVDRGVLPTGSEERVQSHFVPVHVLQLVLPAGDLTLHM